VIDDAELAAALERALPPPVRILARRPSPYASSFPLAELDVEAGDGARLTVVWKDLTPSALMAGARRARDGATGWAGTDSARELRAYALLDDAGLGTPRLVAALHEPERTWLFLEAVRGARLEHVGDPAAWDAAARWLARAHAELATRATAATWPPPWAFPDPMTLLARAAERGDPPQRLRRIEALADPLKLAAARAAAGPPAVIHGELYAANVLIADDGRVCALDWETIARGPALLDLAALTAGAWDDPAERLAEAYRQALSDPPPAAQLHAELDAARLLTAAHWLAAPSGWDPPPEQARDWLADAELVENRIASA
jgi:aminoglycoside phosphotransferase (APT) family kinase protein